MPGETRADQFTSLATYEIFRNGRPPFVVSRVSDLTDWDHIRPGSILQVVDPEPSLTEEEDRMLAAFRRFKASLAAPEGSFYWKTQPEPGVIPAPERFLIIDPSADPKEDWNANPAHSLPR